MKTYGKESFLPYTMEVMEAVLQEPYRLDAVPRSERAEILEETPFKWTYTLKREGWSDVVYDCDSSYDSAQKTLTIHFTSRVKKLTDDCIITLYRVGDFRTRMYVTYHIRYNMLKWTHAWVRIRVALSGHKSYVDTIFHLIDKINELAAEKQKELS